MIKEKRDVFLQDHLFDMGVYTYLLAYEYY